MSGKVNFSRVLRKYMDLDVYNLMVKLYHEKMRPVLLKSECRYDSSGEKDYYYRALAYLDDIYENTLSMIDKVKDLLRDYENVEFDIAGDFSSVVLELWGNLLEKFLERLSRTICKLPLPRNLSLTVSLSPTYRGSRYGLELKIAYCWRSDEIMINGDKVSNALIDSIENITRDHIVKIGASNCDCLDGAGISITIMDSDDFRVGGRDIILDTEKLEKALQDIIEKSRKNIVKQLGLAPETLDKEYISIKSFDPFRETTPSEEEIISIIYMTGEKVFKKLDCSCQNVKRYYIILKSGKSIVFIDIIPLKEDIYLKIECGESNCEEKFLLNLLKHYYRKRREEAEKYVQRLAYTDLLQLIDERGGIIQILKLLNKEK